VAYRAAVLVEHTAIDDDARADGALARFRIVDDEIVVELAEHGVPECRTGDFGKRIGERHRSPLGGTHDGALVTGRECRRMPCSVALEKTRDQRQRVSHFSSPE